MGKKKTYLLGMIWALSNFIAKRAAQAYIVGPELNDAMGVCDRLSKNGFSSTIGFWSAEEESARKVADAYVAGLMALKEKNTDCYLSIKLPAIGFSSQLLAEVLQKGKQNSVRIHFDSHGTRRLIQRGPRLLRRSRFTAISAAFCPAVGIAVRRMPNGLSKIILKCGSSKDNGLILRLRISNYVRASSVSSTVLPVGRVR